jgi:hypothetical protein
MHCVIRSFAAAEQRFVDKGKDEINFTSMRGTQ